MTQIVIGPPDDHGVRWIHVQFANGRKRIGGYEASTRAESLRLALGMALRYKRQKSKRAAIVVLSGGAS